MDKIEKKYKNYSINSMKRTIVELSGLGEETSIGEIKNFLKNKIDTLNKERFSKTKEDFKDLLSKVYKVKRQDNYIIIFKVSEILNIGTNYDNNIDAIINGEMYVLYEGSIEYEIIENQWFSKVVYGDKEEVSLDLFNDIARKYKELLKYYE